MQNEPVLEATKPKTPASPPPTADEELPAEKPLDSYQGLRDDLKEQLQSQYQEKMAGFLHPEPNPHYAATAAQLVAQNSFRYLPKAEITQEHLSQAINTTQNELAARKLWFEAVLPDDPIRIDIARSVASHYTPEKMVSRTLGRTTSTLAAAVEDYQNQVAQSQEVPPKREELMLSVQSEIRKAGVIDKKICEKTSKRIVNDLNRWTFTYQAAPSSNIIQETLDRHSKKHLKDTSNLAKNLSENSIFSKHYQAGAHNRGLVAGRSLRAINKLASGRLVGGARKLGKAVDVVRHPLTYAGKALTAPVRFAARKITRPITKAVRRVVRRAAIKTAKAVGRFLTKIGMETFVKNVERIVLTGTVVGIPLLIAQEAAQFGLGKLIQAGKSLRESWRRTSQSRNIVEATANTLGASLDTLGAGAGGLIGGTVGTIGGAAIGALVGTVLGPVGTVLGGLLGSAAGGLFGAGVGANAGANLRKKLKRALAIKLSLKLLMQKLAGLIQLIKLTIGGAAVGAGIGLIFGGPVGALIGAIVGGIVTHLLPKAIVAVKQLGFIGTYGLTKAATAANQLVFTIVPHYVTIGFQKVSAVVGGFFKNLASGIAQTFNKATGTLAGTTTETAATIEAAVSEITTAGPSAALVATPVAAIGTITLFTFITYAVLIAAFRVPPTQVAESPFVGFPVECTDEKLPIAFGNNTPSNIAKRAWQITSDLYQGFWCYWNRSPGDFPSDVCLYPPCYPQLFDEQLFLQNPFPTRDEVASDASNLFWCTQLVVISYNETGGSIYQGYMSNSMQAWFTTQGRFVNASVATPSNIVPGSVIFFRVESGPARTNHVAIVHHLAGVDAINFVQANSPTKEGSIVFNPGGVGVQNLPGIIVVGFGLP